MAKATVILQPTNVLLCVCNSQKSVLHIDLIIMKSLVSIDVLTALGLGAIAWAGESFNGAEASAARCVCIFVPMPK